MEPEELLRLAEAALERDPEATDRVNRIIRRETAGTFRDITQLRGAVQTRSGRSRLEQVPGSFARGFAETGTGIAQAALEAFGPEGASEILGEEVARERRQREATGGDEPFSRFIGQAASLLPLAFLPGGQGSLLARLASGGAAGAVAGATLPTESGRPESRAFNAAIGAPFGAVAPEVVRAGARPAAALGRRLLGRAGPTDDALARQADFEALGLQPTSGQLTQNPNEIARELTLAQQDVGAPILARRAGQSTRLSEMLDEAVPGPRMTQTQAGREITETLGQRQQTTGSSIFNRLREATNRLFERARNSAGADEVLDADAFLNFSPQNGRALANVLDDFEDAIPRPVMRRLESFAKDRDFTIREAAKFRQLLNSRIRNSDEPATQAALGEIKGLLDDFMASADVSGEAAEAMELFQRGIAASRRQNQAFSGELQKVASGQVPVDDFVSRFIINSGVDDLRQLRVTLLRQGGEQGQQSWQIARRQVIEFLTDKAVNDQGAFKASSFNRALDRIGRDKLRVLFEDGEVELLERIGRVGTAAFSRPPTGGVSGLGNPSGTAPALIGQLPGFGGIQSLRQSGNVGRALQASPFDVLGNRQAAASAANLFTNPGGANPFAPIGGLAGLLSARDILNAR